MANTIQHKRSSTASDVPTSGQLSLGEIAINTYDGKVFIKKNDGSDSIVEVGASGGSTSTPYEQSFVATANQTNFTLSNTPQAAWVWVNGAAQDASEWSISGDDIVLTTDSTVNDLIEIYYLTGTTVSGIIASSVSYNGSTNLVATDVEAALDELDTEKAPLASPAFTGTPTSPTPSAADDSTKIATTAYVDFAVLGASGGFASGTLMLFQQTAAPTGWTKETTHNNKALRVVSGTVSSGGSVDFDVAFASQSVAGTVNNTTLTISQMPAHTHSYNTVAGSATAISGGKGSDIQSATTGSKGGGGSHNHTFTGTAINLDVKYVDLIIASKD